MRGIPLVICSFGGGGPELLNCQEFDFWPQLFISSRPVPPHKANPRLSEEDTTRTAYFYHITETSDLALSLYF